MGLPKHIQMHLQLGLRQARLAPSPNSGPETLPVNTAQPTPSLIRMFITPGPLDSAVRTNSGTFSRAWYDSGFWLPYAQTAFAARLEAERPLGSRTVVGGQKPQPVATENRPPSVWEPAALDNRACLWINLDP